MSLINEASEISIVSAESCEVWYNYMWPGQWVGMMLVLLWITEVEKYHSEKRVYMIEATALETYV